MSPEIVSLKRYFELRSSHVSDYWLQCCVEWFKGEYNTYTEDFLCSSVYQQWLDSDLREIEVRSLPNNISQEKKTSIDGKYVVQVLYIVDISKPAYSQLKNIRDMYKLTRGHVDTDNEHVEASGKRVLRLYLTDGVQNITAFEYQTVNCLNLYLTPGVKLLLTGSLLVRNGEFMLKDNNVQILAGEVEALKIVNAAENVLARQLKMPETNNPRTTAVADNNSVNTRVSIYTPHTTNTNHTQNTRHNNNEQIQNNHEVDLDLDDQFLVDFDTSALERDQRLQLQQNNNQNCDFDQNDDLFENLDFTEPQINGNNSNSPPNRNIQQQNIEEVEQMEFEQDLEQTERMEFERRMEEEEDFDFHLEDDVDLDTIIQQKQTTVKPLPVITTHEPFIYIRYLEENSDKLAAIKTYRVKARFVKNVEKLKLSKNTGWSMRFEIKDSSGKLTVNFVSDVIQELMELSPSEALAENRSVKKKESKSHEKLTRALDKCKEKLETFEYIMDLRCDRNNFTIVNLEKVTGKHLEEIKKRVQNSAVKLL